MEPMVTAQLTTIIAALRDCLAWCGRLRIDPPPDLTAYRGTGSWYDGCDDWAELLTHPRTPAALLRSDELADSALQVLSPEARDCYGGRHAGRSLAETDPMSAPAFERFVQARRRFLGNRLAHAVPSQAEIEQELVRPRAFVVADWQATVWDGAAAAASAGFVDLYDVPAWDTWIALAEPSDLVSTDRPFGSCIVSWVPTWAGELVEDAIRVNPVGCLSWGSISTIGITVKGWGRPWHDPAAA